MPALALPGDKREAIEAAFPDGRQWCDDFVRLLRDFGRRWGLTYSGFAADGLATNVVVFAQTSEGMPVVLKTGYPDAENLTSIIALEAYGGRNVVRLMGSDLDRQVMLMERIVPGTSLREAGRNGAVTGDPLQLFTTLPVIEWSGAGLPTFGHWLDQARRDYLAFEDGDQAFLMHLDRAIGRYQDLTGPDPAPCFKQAAPW